MREAEHVFEWVAGYGERLGALLERLPDLRIPWSGVPIVERPGRRYTAVYEVNGLPFLYPSSPPALLERVRELEQRCLERADVVITPSQVTADRLGVDAVVIRNGAD